MAINKKNEIAATGEYPANRLGQRERKVLQTADQYSPQDPSAWAVQPTTLDEAVDQLASSLTVSKTFRFIYDASIDGLTKDLCSLPSGTVLVSFVDARTVAFDKQPTLHIGADAYTLSQTVGALQTNTIKLITTATPISVSFTSQPTTGRLLIYLQTLAGT